MSPAHVLEPTYRRLKLSIVEGRWLTGTRLETKRLADDFGVSATPVRDSLNQLVGEGLVDLTPGEGFRVPALGEQQLREILDVNLALLEHALDTGWKGSVAEDDAPHSVDYAGRMSGVLGAIAAGGGNRFLVNSVERINERLFVVRNLETTILPNALDLLEDLECSLEGGNRSRADALHQYHRQCRVWVPELIAALSG